jgi:hypothetical protein
MDFKLLGGSRKSNLPVAQNPLVLAAFAEVRAYWEGLRLAGSIPARTDLDPRGMKGALDKVFIAQRIAKGIVRIRIAGSALGDLAGMDLRGLPLSCLFQPDARPRLSAVVERVLYAPVAADLQLEALSRLGQSRCDGRLLMLPLLDVDQSRSLVLGCLSLDGQVGPARRPLSICRATEDPLGLVAAATAADFAANPDTAKYSHLRLVHSAG